jgi:4-carboxymuconolactone decarboxylase
MARVSLIEEDDHPELAELIARIRSGRRGSLINVYRVLLHSPPLAETWFEHMSAVRWKTGLDGKLRELVIIRVAILNRVDYVIRQHVPKLALAEGLTLAQCEALADWRGSDLYTEAQRAALAYADAMTRDAAVTDAQHAELRRHFDERQVVELAVLIGAYNMHTRVFGALRIDPEPAGS